MKCLACEQEILADDAKICPYCFSKNLEKQEVDCVNILKCPVCGSEMRHKEVSLRMVDSSDSKQLLKFALFDNVGGELVVPVLMHICGKCGKIEFSSKVKPQ